MAAPFYRRAANIAVRAAVPRGALLAGRAVGVAALLGSYHVASAQGVTTSFLVGGNVTAPRTFTLPDLQVLPAITENVSFLAGNSTTNTTFTGAGLFSLLNNTVGIKTNPNVKQDIIRNVVIATGSDGYQAVYSIGEINPTFGGPATNPNLVAYANNPGQLLTSDGFARTTVPGDTRGGRYVSNLQSLTVFHAPLLTGSFPGGLSTQFTVTGAVNNAATFDLAKLTALPATTVNVSGPTATYTGVSLWTLLNSVGVTTNPQVKNNILRDFVIATGSDGFQATVSMGEIDPDFGPATTVTNPNIIACAMNGGVPGTSLGANGFARLITPLDTAHGRWVSNLVNLEIFDVSQWKALAGEIIDLGNFNYQTLGFTLAGGTLTSTGGPGTLTAPRYTLSGGLIDTNAALGPTGAVMQTGGTTVLNGTIATPNVSITGGTLQLGAANRLASNTTLSLIGGVLDLNGFSQTISTLSGGGLVSLGTAASSGALTVGSGNFSGVIADGGARPGSVTVGGPGTFTLSGTSTYTGPTTVNGGTLAVNGSIAGSTVTVNLGGTLAGTGMAGPTTIAGGRLSPGNSIGTLTVNGQLSFSPSSTYLVEVSPTAADRTNATSTASLGGTVQATLQSGNYIPKNYTILSASGLSGTFGSLAATGVPFGLSAALSYSATVVNLNLTSVLGQTVGLNGNQTQVAGAIDHAFNAGAGSAGSALAGLYGSSPAALPSSLSELAGEVATGAPTTAFRATDQFLGLMLDPLVNPSLGGGTGRALAAASREQTAALPGSASDTQVADATPGSPLYFRNYTVWGAGFGSTGSADGSASTGSSQLSASNVGGGAGIDFWAAPNLVVGFAAAGGSMDWNTGSLGTGHGTIAQGGIYAATWFDNAYLTGAFLYGHDDLSTSRSVNAGGTLDQLAGSYGADHFAGRAEGGWRFALTPTYGVTPYAAVQVQSFDTGSYTEQNGSGLTAFALQYSAQTTTDTRTELGARIDSAPMPITGIGDGAAAMVLRGRAAWAHDSSPDRNLTASFAALPAAGFTVTGAREASDAALLSAGAELRLTPTIALTAKFDTLQAANAHAYAGTAALRMTW